MNNRFFSLLVCMSVASGVHARSSLSPFAHMRETFAAFDKMFQDMEERYVRSEGRLRLSYAQEGDAVILTITGIQADETVAADSDGKELQIKIGACDISIRARGRYLSIESVRRAEPTSDADTKENAQNMQYLSRSSEVITVSRPLYIGEVMHDAKALSLDKNSGTLTIRIPTKKATQSLSIHVAESTEPSAEEQKEEK